MRKYSYTRPSTFVKRSANRSLTTYQISAQFVQLFPRYGKGGTSARAHVQMSKVKNTVFAVWNLVSVSLAAKRLNSPKTLLYVYQRCWISTKVILKKMKVKVRSQKVTKYKVTCMPYDACFLGHFTRRCQQWWLFDPMTLLNLTFDGSQVKVRSNKVKILNQYFCINSTCFWLGISTGFQICPQFSFTMCRTPKNCKSKMTAYHFCYITL